MELWVAGYLIYSFLVMLSIERLMGVFFETRRANRAIFLGSFLFYFVIGSIVYFVFGMTIVNIAITLFGLFIISLNYDSSTVKNLLGSIGASEVYSDTGNTAFDSIINFKLKNAADENIKLELNILAPPATDIEAVDIVTILGNLLDNALDAVAKVQDKIIKLNIEYSKGNLFIKVENTFDGEVNYEPSKNGENGETGKASRAGKEKMPATRKEGSNHGHGLANIQKSAEKYNGHVDITHDGNVFTVSVLLYL